MNRSIVRHINRTAPANVTISHKGVSRDREHCDSCGCGVERGGVVIPLKAFEERFACALCVRRCRATFSACARVLGITHRELAERARQYRHELSDGEAVMPWHHATAAEMVVCDAGKPLPAPRSRQDIIAELVAEGLLAAAQAEALKRAS